MALMNIVDLARDVAVPRIAADVHALRWLCSPSPNSISGPSNWVITLKLVTAYGGGRAGPALYIGELGQFRGPSPAGHVAPVMAL